MDESGYLRSVDVVKDSQSTADRDPNYINIHQPHLNPGPTPKPVSGLPKTGRSSPPGTPGRATPPGRQTPPITPGRATPPGRQTPPITPGRATPPSTRGAPTYTPPYTPRRLLSTTKPTPNPEQDDSQLHVVQRMRSTAPSVSSTTRSDNEDFQEAHNSGETVELPTSRKMSRVAEVRFNITEKQKKKKKKKKNKLSKARPLKPGEMHYGVNDVPPWYLCILLGFQHYLIMFGATVSNPLVLAPHLCITDSDEDKVVKSQLIGTIFFVSGICTFLQATIGIRLPIIQGGTFTFVTPVLAIMSLPQWECPAASTTVSPASLTTIGLDPTATSTTLSLYSNVTDIEPPWKSRMREIQGAIMVASLFQLVIGFTGIIGMALRFIGPLSVAPTIALVGLALFKEAARYAAKQWWITLVTVILIAAFSQYTKNINVPCFHFKKGQGCQKVNVPIFRLFPVILAIAITWAICAILTATNVFPEEIRTDIRIHVLESAPWFRVPYPGQWGLPTVSTAAVFGMLSGVMASMVESVGDYYACARLSSAPPPPMHAVNRGIGIEGLGCIIAGAWGHGSGTTSYSENIGAIGITRVASRRVVQVGALTMVIFGVFGKFGALFVTIPEPIIGGVFIVMFGMITAVGISNLQFVDLNSSRNLFIIGFSFFFGLTLPAYLKENKDALDVGVPELNQILTVLLSTSMFVGGLAGFVLDNTIPGTKEERGLTKWRETLVVSQSAKKKRSRDRPEVTEEERQLQVQRATAQCYDIPGVTKYLQDKHWAKYIPFLPTFDESLLSCRKRKDKRNRDEEDGMEEEAANMEDGDSRV